MGRVGILENLVNNQIIYLPFSDWELRYKSQRTQHQMEKVMTAVNVYVVRGEKQVKRYTECFFGPCDIRPENRKAVALKRVSDRFGRCYPGCKFVLAVR